MLDNLLMKIIDMFQPKLNKGGFYEKYIKYKYLNAKNKIYKNNPYIF